jgi:hypothetical protein
MVDRISASERDVGSWPRLQKIPKGCHGHPAANARHAMGPTVVRPATTGVPAAVAAGPAPAEAWVGLVRAREAGPAPAVEAEDRVPATAEEAPSRTGLARAVP